MSKDVISTICSVAGIVGALICGIWTIIIQVKNPDATEMRVLIDHPQLLVCVIICFVLAFIGGLTSSGGHKRW